MRITGIILLLLSLQLFAQTKDESSEPVDLDSIAGHVRFSGASSNIQVGILGGNISNYFGNPVSLTKTLESSSKGKVFQLDFGLGLMTITDSLILSESETWNTGTAPLFEFGLNAGYVVWETKHTRTVPIIGFKYKWTKPFDDATSGITIPSPCFGLVVDFKSTFLTKKEIKERYSYYRAFRIKITSEHLQSNRYPRHFNGNIVSVSLGISNRSGLKRK